MKLFLLDAAGALVSAFFIGIVFRLIYPVTGLPSEILLVLGIIPLFFVAADLLFLFTLSTWAHKGFLLIAVLNIGYVILSLSVLFIFRDTVTFWGWIYFLPECMIVATLSYIELKSYRSINSSLLASHNSV